MSDTIIQIYPSDRRANARVDALLEGEGIRRDRNLDYTCGLFDDAWNLIATGSCFGNTIRCLAVSKARQGEGLLNKVIGHLMEVQLMRGNGHLFLYTKPHAAKFLSDLGFHEIARVPDLVFMENRREGFRRYCQSLQTGVGTYIAGIVMNANPFTLGHRHLVERAAQENDVVHLFVLSEEAGPIPFAVRKKLVREGVADIPNVILHDSGPYIISSATFPSYFLKDEDTVIRTQAELDLKVFGKIAKHLGIQRRYVGEERASHVTALYNDTMRAKLPELGVECIEIPRRTSAGKPISASLVRQAIHDDCLETVRDFLPASTYHYFSSPESAPVHKRIKAESNVIHD